MTLPAVVVAVPDLVRTIVRSLGKVAALHLGREWEGNYSLTVEVVFYSSYKLSRRFAQSLSPPSQNNLSQNSSKQTPTVFVS